MLSEKRRVEPTVAIRVKSLNDLARFAASMSTLGQTIYIVHFEYGGKHIYGLFAVYHDYYNMYGLPILYYYATEEKLNGKYLLIRTEENKEYVVVSDGSRPGWVTIPIISLEEPPPFTNFD
ncbi:MAG: cren protein [Candidatus Nezhaarchaeota archaeon]|nr:cren protein [Candidatus Nezhaarchaeota archaeon]MCX8141339.1 cren protein [Candidatus Nezhaarchaeota archaeon]MDW8049605.1 cren protein [Nitrososphaerota archaeon]